MPGFESKIRAVLFDADGVIQRNRAGWLESVKSLCSNTAETDNFLVDLFAAERPCMIGQADFRTELASVLKRWNCQSTTAEALRLWHEVEPVEAVLEVVDRLRQNKTVVALATNQQKYRAEYMLRDLGYENRFDQIFCSFDIGHTKPMPEYFQACINRLELRSESVLLIDDSETNVQAAKEMGLKAVGFEISQGARSLEGLLIDYGLLSGS